MLSLPVPMNSKSEGVPAHMGPQIYTLSFHP
jgi:hypothetical protein